MIEDRVSLKEIRKGMSVHDVEGQKVGKINFVHFGVEEYLTNRMKTPIAERNIDLVPPDVWKELPLGRLPQNLRQQMLQMGFVKVNTGFFSADRFVLPDQIADRIDDALQLNVAKDDLHTLS